LPKRPDWRIAWAVRSRCDNLKRINYGFADKWISATQEFRECPDKTSVQPSGFVFRASAASIQMCSSAPIV
jgi:hypothetical protein